MFLYSFSEAIPIFFNRLTSGFKFSLSDRYKNFSLRGRRKKGRGEGGGRKGKGKGAPALRAYVFA